MYAMCTTVYKGILLGAIEIKRERQDGQKHRQANARARVVPSSASTELQTDVLYKSEPRDRRSGIISNNPAMNGKMPNLQ